MLCLRDPIVRSDLERVVPALQPLCSPTEAFVSLVPSYSLVSFVSVWRCSSAGSFYYVTRAYGMNSDSRTEQDYCSSCHQPFQLGSSQLLFHVMAGYEPRCERS